MRLLKDEGLLSKERTELLLSWRHTGFSVHNRVRVEPEDQSAVERLVRYIMRPPISLDRMSWDGEGEVRYSRKRGHESPGLEERGVETFEPFEFLARLIMPISETTPTTSSPTSKFGAPWSPRHGPDTEHS